MKLIRNSFICFYFLSAFILMLMVSCKHKPTATETVAVQKPKNKISFVPVKNIAYTEVKRVFDNGLIFAPMGYQLTCNWKITFLSADSVRIYSPKLKHFINCPVVVDHDSIANVAWTWIKVLKRTPDSLVFKVLNTEERVVQDTKPYIVMTLYSNNYIKNVLHTTPEALQVPSKRDTLFIRRKVDSARADYRRAFAATQPVIFSKKSPNISIVKELIKEDLLNNIIAEQNYLSPTYNIVIHHAYSNFNHFMLVIADEQGKLHFVKSLDLLLDDGERENHLKVMKGIVDGYLTYYLNVRPGKTLGMAHASPVMMHVKGIAD